LFDERRDRQLVR